MTLDETVDVSVVVVTYNAPEWTAQCLDALAGEGRPAASHEVVVLDNASEEPTRRLLAERAAADPSLRVHLSPQNLGFAAACNRAAELGRGRYVLLLNPDAVVLPGAVDALLAFLEQDPRRGIVGGRVLYPDGSVSLTSCFAQPTLWSWFCYATGLSTAFKRSPVFDPESLGRWDRDSVRDVGVVSGAFLLASRETWDALGGFDEAFFMYSEDADLSARAIARGLHPSVTPDAVVVHAGGKSSSSRTGKLRMLMRGKAEFARKHWSPARAAAGIGLLAAGAGLRTAGEKALALVGRGGREETWAPLWRERRDWGAGWPADAVAAVRGPVSGELVTVTGARAEVDLRERGAVTG
ncbi:glycosyltransferase family 2 protein [Kineococcus esterisolvens]|uniref:glycosyltransferase family 2 protein n=1 Tax=unclassified Kineococcus TaxID=2621656 RepID=UPI003D7D8015